MAKESKSDVKRVHTSLLQRKRHEGIRLVLEDQDSSIRAPAAILTGRGQMFVADQDSMGSWIDGVFVSLPVVQIHGKYVVLQC